MTDTSVANLERPNPRPRRWRWHSWAKLSALAAGYAALGVGAHLAGPRYVDDLTLLAYAVAEVGGAAFLARYVRTDWRTHPWGRHVMAFMVCMEVIFTLSLSRRIFGDWPGLPELLFMASVTFAGIVWWRYQLLAHGGRADGRASDNARTVRNERLTD